MRPLEEDTSQELFLWILNPEQWTPLELDPSVNSSDLTTSSSDKVEPETTGPRDTTLKELNLLTQSLMSPERKLKDATAYKDSKSPTHWEVELDQVWVPSWSLKSEKNIPTELWRLSQLSPHPRSLIPSLSPTTPLSLSINSSKTLMSAWSLTTKPFMISASEPSSSPPPLMVISTIWCQLPCQELPAALDSPVNSTLIWENSLSTLFPSPDCTSSWSDLLPLPQEDLNNTEPSLFLNSLNKCLMPRTWCALLIPDTEDILLPQLSSEEECQPKKSTNKCWTSKTRTLLTSSNGSPTTLNHPFAIFPPRDWRWPSPSLETQLRSKKCSRECLSNSLLCSEEKLSCTGTLVRVWTRWNSLKLNRTWTISFLNINNIKMPLLRKKENSRKKRNDEYIQDSYQLPFFTIILFKLIHQLYIINSLLSFVCQ